MFMPGSSPCLGKFLVCPTLLLSCLHPSFSKVWRNYYKAIYNNIYFLSSLSTSWASNVYFHSSTNLSPCAHTKNTMKSSQGFMVIFHFVWLQGQLLVIVLFKWHFHDKVWQRDSQSNVVIVFVGDWWKCFKNQVAYKLLNHYFLEI
jgi:hypothetical protein